MNASINEDQSMFRLKQKFDIQGQFEYFKYVNHNELLGITISFNKIQIFDRNLKIIDQHQINANKIGTVNINQNKNILMISCQTDKDEIQLFLLSLNQNTDIQINMNSLTIENLLQNKSNQIPFKFYLKKIIQLNEQVYVGLDDKSLVAFQIDQNLMVQEQNVFSLDNQTLSILDLDLFREEIQLLINDDLKLFLTDVEVYNINKNTANLALIAGENILLWIQYDLLSKKFMVLCKNNLIEKCDKFFEKQHQQAELYMRQNKTDIVKLNFQQSVSNDKIVYNVNLKCIYTSHDTIIAIQSNKKFESKSKLIDNEDVQNSTIIIKQNGNVLQLRFEDSMKILSKYQL